MNVSIDFSDYETPYKYGKPILAPSGEPGAFDRFGVDHMRIVRHNGQFYAFYIGFDGCGYRTALATSDDLLHWTPHGVILGGGTAAWDRSGRAVSALLADVELYGSRTLIRHNNRYGMLYHAYPGAGYEVGAAANGWAWTTDESLRRWTCEPAPVFEKGTDGAWDSGGLYSTWIVPHGGGYVLFYNGKEQTAWPWHEQVGIAQSDTVHGWVRYAGNPVLRVTPNHWDSVFSCGQHVLHDARRNRWVMFYCGFDGHHAQDGVAVSDDLLHWKKCGRPLIPHGKPGELDETHAHKPCVIWHNGALYHFYCAVRPTRTNAERRRFGKEFRCLTVARSVPFES